MATAKQALQEARTALASGWTRGPSTRASDGSISWNLAQLIDRLSNKHALPRLREALEAEALARGAVDLDDFATKASIMRADVLALLDSAISKQAAATKGG